MCTVCVGRDVFLSLSIVPVVIFSSSTVHLLHVIGSRMLMEIVARVTPAKRPLLMISRLRLDFGCDHEFNHLTGLWSNQSSITVASKFCVITSWSESFSSWRKWDRRFCAVPTSLTNIALLAIPQTPATRSRVSQEDFAVQVCLGWR